MKIGDTVRFLNDVGGGKVSRIDGQIAYVTDADGFETPMMIKELVVVLPAGHKSAEDYGNSARLMFDQKAVDAVKAREREEREAAKLTKEIAATVEEPAPLPVEETAHGEKINAVLAFEPSDIKKLGTADFAAVLVNDSNYFLKFTYLTRGHDERGWSVAYEGEVEPNMLVDLANYTKEELPRLEQIAVQMVAYKKDKAFTLKAPMSVKLRPDLTKFYKFHCFRPGIYFDSPVLEFPLVRDDLPVGEPRIEPKRLAEATGADVSQLREKYRNDNARGRKETGHGRSHGKQADDSANPNKLLPLIEVDLHIGELVDTTAGMDSAAMLELQLDTAMSTMKENARRIGQKIVFIHGKGDGVLRNRLWQRLRREYPKADLQDASFREYGFGATLVTIH